MLSGRSFCNELITRPEESYRLWRVVVCDIETAKEEAKSPLKGCEYKPRVGCDAERKNSGYRSVSHMSYSTVHFAARIRNLTSDFSLE